ncbi:MAG: calcium-binding protein [Neisseria sp.]|nr:calcium-binding protein [Neisseria sp.]
MFSTPLNGRWGDETLIGGTGNDRLQGGLGSDAYVFAKGDGQDKIYDLGGDNDVIRFSDLTAGDLWFSRSGSHLEIQVIGSEDRITVENHHLWFFGKPNQIEQIHTADGKQINAEQLDRLIEKMATFKPQDNAAESVSTQMQNYAQQTAMEEYWTAAGSAAII